LLYEYAPNINYLAAMWMRDVTCLQHLHYNIEIVLVKSGVLNMTLHGKPLTLKAGEAILIAPYVLHGFSCETPHIVCILEYPPEYTPQLFDLLKNHQSSYPVIRMHETLRSYLWHMLPFEWEQTHLPLMRAQAILMPLSEAFVSNCVFSPIEERYSDNFIHAMRLVSYNFQKPITLDGVAEKVGIRRETLIRLFRRQTGSTFWDYVLTLRTKYAITLMRQGKSIADSAYDAGFGSIRSFNRVFLDKIGMSPTEYMKQEPQGDSYLYAPEFPWLKASDGIVD